MKILRIIAKEIKQNIRDFKSNIMMVLFPIVLIVILGAAFSGSFDNTVDLSDMKVSYTADVTDRKDFEQAFEAFRKSMADELGIQFEKTDDVNAGMASIENSAYSAYLHITDNPLQFELYKNERMSFEASLFESALNSFIKTYDTAAAIAAINPAALTMPEMRDSGKHVQLRSLDKRRQPGSLDYYAVAMLTMILMYASLSGFWSIRSEAEQKTSARTLCAPVHGYEFLTGKVIGGIFVTIAQGLVVILFSKLVLKAYWGEHLWPVFLLVLTYSVMVVSLGVALAYAIKNGEAANGILNTAIPLLVFLGGGYVPLDVMDGVVSKIAVISPVSWINTALFKIIYESDYSAMPASMIFSLSLAALFIVVSALLSTRGDRAYA